MKTKKSCAILTVLAILALVPLRYAPAAPMVPDKEPPEVAKTAREMGDAGPSDVEGSFGQHKRAACVSLPDGTVFGIVMTKTTDLDRQESVSTVRMFQRPEGDAFVKDLCRKIERKPERVKASNWQDEVRWFLIEY